MGISMRDREARWKWEQEGIDRGWVQGLVCSTHDTYLTDEEAEQFWDGEDPCIVVMRVLDDYTPPDRGKSSRYYTCANQVLDELKYTVRDRRRRRKEFRDWRSRWIFGETDGDESV